MKTGASTSVLTTGLLALTLGVLTLGVLTLGATTLGVTGPAAAAAVGSSNAISVASPVSAAASVVVTASTPAPLYEEVPVERTDTVALVALVGSLGLALVIVVIALLRRRGRDRLPADSAGFAPSRSRSSRSSRSSSTWGVRGAGSSGAGATGEGAAAAPRANAPSATKPSVDAAPQPFSTGASPAAAPAAVFEPLAFGAAPGAPRSRSTEHFDVPNPSSQTAARVAPEPAAPAFTDPAPKTTPIAHTPDPLPPVTTPEPAATREPSMLDDVNELLRGLSEPDADPRVDDEPAGEPAAKSDGMTAFDRLVLQRQREQEQRRRN